MPNPILDDELFNNDKPDDKFEESYWEDSFPLKVFFFYYILSLLVWYIFQFYNLVDSETVKKISPTNDGFNRYPLVHFSIFSMLSYISITSKRVYMEHIQLKNLWKESFADVRFLEMLVNLFELLVVGGILLFFNFIIGIVFIIPLSLLSVDMTVFPGKDMTIILAGFGYYAYPIFALIYPVYKDR